MAGIVARMGDSESEDIGNPADIPPSRGLTSDSRMPNIVLFIIDDAGREKFRLSGKPADSFGYVKTPNIDALCERGVNFTRAVCAPACSMTRMWAEFGRYGFRTGMGFLAESGAQPVLPNEIALPRMVKQVFGNSVRCGKFGKNHIATSANGNEKQPVQSGWDAWTGTLANLVRGVQDYYSWNRYVTRANPEKYAMARCNRYVTTQQVDDAIEWVNNGDTEPFVCWVAFNAPHFPLHRPPAALYDTSLYQLPTMDAPNSSVPTQQLYFAAMLQAIDTEIGRFRAEIGPDKDQDTYYFVLADNGSTSGVVSSPYQTSHAKFSVYQLGVNIPLFVAGPTVDLPGRSSDAIVSLTDLPRTIIELLGGTWSDVTTLTPYDGVSIKALIENHSAASSRSTAYTENFTPNGANLNAATPGSRAIQGTQYKLLWFNTGTTFPQTTGTTSEFYDLIADPNETVNLTPAGSIAGLTAGQLTAWNSLVATAQTLLAT